MCTAIAEKLPVFVDEASPVGALPDDSERAPHVALGGGHLALVKLVTPAG
ncbi:hypothetical protein OOK31_05375 [Streptomyces sp. NBC_00249]|nr:hypothetical protein [Streptomyces sp. NBC_00249]MCX5193325.1 hypothetical protein [Streptomyces sp. NBC_00249]